MKLDMMYDPEADATFLRFSTATILESEEVFPGVILDFDEEGRVVGMEVLTASKVLTPATGRRRDRRARRAPPLRNSSPERKTPPWRGCEVISPGRPPGPGRAPAWPSRPPHWRR